MPPKRASAKAKAKAKQKVKNDKRDARRSAVKNLNTLAKERGAASAQVDPKTATGGEVEGLIRLLESRCSETSLQQRLRAAADKFKSNGGTLLADLAPAPDLNSPPAVAKHRVLMPDF